MSTLATNRPIGREAVRAESRGRGAWLLREPVLLLVALLASALSLAWGSGQLPLRGEESRWACGARWMIRSGDWIVPRQQGTVFPERPPLNSWLMAIAGIARGEVDLAAIRLPSLMATLAVMALLYLVGARIVSPSVGFLAAMIYGSFGQVLQLGWAGESEAVFTAWVSGSLLTWYVLWESDRPEWQAWLVGFGLAALGALTKGLQAPVYFALGTALFLVWNGQWRQLVSFDYLLGAALFAAIVGAWLVPFYRATDLDAVVDIWTGLARDRVQWSGLLKHVAGYPLETLACLLPWSPLLFQFAYREVRQVIRDSAPSQRRLIAFLVGSLAATYPSVWWVAAARGRYFMPMYPLIALLIAIGIDATRATSRGWSRSGLRLWRAAVAVPVAGFSVALLIAPLLDVQFEQWLGRWGLAEAVVGCSGLAVAFGLMRMQADLIRPAWGLHTWLVLLFGFVLLPAYGRQLNDLGPRLTQLRQDQGIDRLVSFGPVYHRFVYYYGQAIEEWPWPGETQVDVSSIDYFCFGVLRGDTPERRGFGRGRSWRPVPGQLPFEWTEVARIGCDPQPRKHANRTVVIGRIVRDEQGRVVRRGAPSTPAAVARGPSARRRPARTAR